MSRFSYSSITPTIFQSIAERGNIIISCIVIVWLHSLSMLSECKISSTCDKQLKVLLGSNFNFITTIERAIPDWKITIKEDIKICFPGYRSKDTTSHQNSEWFIQLQRIHNFN